MQAFTDKTNEAISAVAAANGDFIDRALLMLRRDQFPAPFTADQLTHATLAAGMVPTHNRVIGAVILRAVKLGLIERTGEFRLRTFAPPTGHTSNHPLPVYKVV